MDDNPQTNYTGHTLLNPHSTPNQLYEYGTGDYMGYYNSNPFYTTEETHTSADREKTFDFAEKIIDSDKEYNVDSGRFLSEGFSLFKTHWIYFGTWGIIYTICYALSILARGFPFWLLQIPLDAGLFYVGFSLLRSRSSRIGPKSFLQGFIHIWPVLGISILVSMAILAGLIFLIIPGIYVAVCLVFSLPLYMEYPEIGIIDCLRVSMTVVRKNFVQVFVFLVVLFLVQVLGLLFVVGAFVAIPVARLALCSAFVEIIGLREQFILKLRDFTEDRYNEDEEPN